MFDVLFSEAITLLEVRTHKPMKDEFRRSQMSNWGIYAAAAGASLSMATNADAGIIHQSLNISVTLANDGSNAGTAPYARFNFFGAPIDLDVENNPARVSQSSLGSSSGRSLRNIPRVGFVALGGLGGAEKVKFFDTSHLLARRYALNAPIGVGNHLDNSAFPIDVTGGVRRGLFGPNSSGFVGFETQSGDLGWLRIAIADRNHDGYPDQATLVDYAYNSVAGGAIEAGQMDTSSPTPEPASGALMLLAAGSAGIMALRRCRK